MLGGAFVPTHNTRGVKLFRASLVIVLLGLVSYFGMLNYERNALERKDAQLKNDMRLLFSQNFPDEPYLDRPRSQLTNAITRVKSGAVFDTRFHQYLAAVSKIIPRHRAVVDEINFRDDSMIVLCTVSDLSSLDVINQSFNSLDSINAELLSSGARDGKVSGRFRLSIRG